VNILYISSISANPTSGLYYSIPSQVKAQGSFDNVALYNLSDKVSPLLIDMQNFFSIEGYPTLKIKNLPTPFSNPDLVIFEDFYLPKYVNIAKELERLKVPYVIVPRGSLTSGAQKKKWLKKKVFNKIMFEKFARNALAIQYLTINERDTSSPTWNKNSIVIPNGTTKKDRVVSSFNGLKGVFIGRFDPFHKGLDFLLDAVNTLQAELRKNNSTISVHGSERLGFKEQFALEVSKNGLDDIIFVKEGVFNQEKEKVLLSSNFFILTSRFEGHPMGLIEALSYGLPCLITKGTNMGEEVEKYDAGWVAENSAESVTDALKRLIAEKHTLPMKSQNAIELASKYDWNSLARRSHELYVGLVEGSHRLEFTI
jgi:glycosyltransferase involved in cell wall biosynthesis